MRPRGWRNTVEVALFEISNSTKQYPSDFHAYAYIYIYRERERGREMYIMYVYIYIYNEAGDRLLDPKGLDEVSNRIPPTPQHTMNCKCSFDAQYVCSRGGCVKRVCLAYIIKFKHGLYKSYGTNVHHGYLWQGQNAKHPGSRGAHRRGCRSRRFTRPV